MPIETQQTPDGDVPAPTGGMSCRKATEILPWLLNGSLEDRESELLADHLAVCEGCRRELEETARVWSSATEHLPSLAIAEYAQGLPASGVDRERIEKHLAHCSSCRQELALATSAEVVELAPVRRSRTGWREPRAARRRLLAAAASIALTVAGGALIWSYGSRDSVAPLETGPDLASHRPNDAGTETRPGGGVVYADGFESGSMSAWTVVAQSPGWRQAPPQRSEDG